jgi:hypothetical protein
MEIQEGKGPWAREVSRIVPVGQPMTIVIAISDRSNQFDMRVKSCFAHDGQRPPVPLTDQYGCVLRKSMLSQFQKVRGDEYRAGLNRNGGVERALPAHVQRASVLSFAHFYAFKFPDSMSVQIQCTVEVCRNGCPDACERGAYPPPTRILQSSVSIQQHAGGSSVGAGNGGNNGNPGTGNQADIGAPRRHASPLHHHVVVDKEDTPVESGEDELSMATAESSFHAQRLPAGNDQSASDAQLPPPLIYQLMNLTASVHSAAGAPAANLPNVRASDDLKDNGHEPVYRPESDRLVNNRQGDQLSGTDKDADETDDDDSIDGEPVKETFEDKPVAAALSSNEMSSTVAPSSSSTSDPVTVAPVNNRIGSNVNAPRVDIHIPSTISRQSSPDRPVIAAHNVPRQYAFAAPNSFASLPASRTPNPVRHHSFNNLLASPLSAESSAFQALLNEKLSIPSNPLLGAPSKPFNTLNPLNASPFAVAPLTSVPIGPSRSIVPSTSQTGHRLVASLLKHSPLHHFNWIRSRASNSLSNGLFGNNMRLLRHRRSVSSFVPHAKSTGSIKIRRRRSTGSQVFLQKQFQVVTSMDMEFNPTDGDLEQPTLLQGHPALVSG